MMGYDASKLPSAAQQQLLMGQDAMTKQAMAIAGSQPGLAPAQALRNAQRSAEATGLATNQQMGLLRAQESAQNQNLNLQARGLAGSTLQTGRQQDIDVATEQGRQTIDREQFYIEQMNDLLSGQQTAGAGLADTIYGQEDRQKEEDDNYWRNFVTGLAGNVFGAAGQVAVNAASK